MNISRAMNVLIIGIIILCTAPIISATETRSYLVTDHQVVTRSPYLNKIVYYNYVNFPWKSGKVVVSGSPDGTKPANIGWEIQLFNNQKSSASFQFNNASDPYSCVDSDMPPLTVNHLLNVGDNSILVRFYRPCNYSYTSLDIGPVYLVHFDDYESSDEPFLDLPWDYEADGERFEEVAIRMSSFFDHEYPFMGIGITEPLLNSETFVTFDGTLIPQKASSAHDGYDWTVTSGVPFSDPVLAAAPGWASYHSNKTIGNAIYINHNNGYQTRYHHLLDHDLVTKSSEKVWVNDRQKIGEVGFFGNSSSEGSRGAHVHFMVVKDKNDNGSFDDNIPNGIVDPFGWKGSGEDPWSTYTFTDNGIEQTGIKSSYLWKKSMKNGLQTLTSSGAKVGNSGSNTTFNFPSNFVSRDVIFESVTHPAITHPNFDGAPQNSFSSIGGIVSATISDGFDNLITSFTKKFTLTFSYQDHHIARYDPNSISIYSRSDGEDWQIEETTIDIVKKQASALIDHMTEFALLGKKLDAIAPETTIEISGTKVGNYYTSPVVLTLSSVDTPDTSLGVLYSGYSINEDLWKEYATPVTISEEGAYAIEYFSEDKDGNSEVAKTLAFIINFNPLTPTPTVTSTPTNTLIPTNTPTPTQTPSSTSPSTSITSTSTIPISTPTNTQTPVLSATKIPIPTISKSVKSILPTVTREPDNQGEVKSVFAAESGTEPSLKKDNSYPSLNMRNLFIMIVILLTAIILIWYRVTKKNNERS